MTSYLKSDFTALQNLLIQLTCVSRKMIVDKKKNIKQKWRR